MDSILKKNYVISFTFNEWTGHVSRIKQKNERKRLLVDFHDNLSYKLQNLYELKCWLKNLYNWFNDKIYWTGSYKCLYNDCSGKFFCFIEKEPIQNVDVLIVVEYNGLCSHEKIVKKRRCTDVERTKLGLELLGKGISNVHDENVIYNFENDCENDFFKGLS